MKTIFVKDIAKKLLHNKRINLKKAVPTTVFLLAMFFLGRAAAETLAEARLTAGQPVSEQSGGGVSDAAELLPEAENWGLGFGKSGEKPTGNATIDEMKKYDAYYMADGDEKILYLTFDCGYENGNTEPILDALKKHNAQATFFVVGHFLESAPDVVKRMVEDGHTVGNHTYHHPDMSKISDTDSFSKEMNDVAALFREVTGTEMAMYYRPSHEEALKKLTERIHPGAIVLLHSTSKTNGEIMDEILTKWEEMGYTFRTLADFVGEKDQGTPNKI